MSYAPRGAFGVMDREAVSAAAGFLKSWGNGAGVEHGGIVAWQRPLMGCSARRRSALKTASSCRAMSNRLLGNTFGPRPRRNCPYTVDSERRVHVSRNLHGWSEPTPAGRASTSV